MNRNVKIAKQLLKIARRLVASDFLNQESLVKQACEQYGASYTIETDEDGQEAFVIQMDEGVYDPIYIVQDEGKIYVQQGNGESEYSNMASALTALFTKARLEMIGVSDIEDGDAPGAFVGYRETPVGLANVYAYDDGTFAVIVPEYSDEYIKCQNSDEVFQALDKYEEIEVYRVADKDNDNVVFFTDKDEANEFRNWLIENEIEEEKDLKPVEAEYMSDHEGEYDFRTYDTCDEAINVWQ